MIALLPRAEDAQHYALTSANAEPVDELHLTLQYLGDDVTGWDDDRRKLARNIAEAAVSHLGSPLTARVFAHGTFNPDHGPDGDRDPCAVYLIGDSDRLTPLHDLVNTVASALLGEQHETQHEPYLPHMTAAYDAVAGDLELVGDIVFDRVGLFLADDREELPLTAPSPAEYALGAYARGYSSTHQPVTEHSRLRATAVYQAARRGEISEAEAEVDGRRTALVAAAAAQHQSVHDESRAAMLPLIRQFAEQIDLSGLQTAIQAGATRDLRRSQAGDQLLRAWVTSEVVDDWRGALVAAHTNAITAGAAAGAYLLSGGATELRPAPSDLPDPMNPDFWIAQQLGSLGGDVVDALSAEQDDSGLARVLVDGAGVLYALDLELARTWADGALQLYGAAGTLLVTWQTAGADACAGCMAKESGSPYAREMAPPVDHGLCRCVLAPWP
jgi:2'-5' RNA ligase